jgi:hypothetical protein
MKMSSEILCLCLKAACLIKAKEELNSDLRIYAIGIHLGKLFKYIRVKQDV